MLLRTLSGDSLEEPPVKAESLQSVRDMITAVQSLTLELDRRLQALEERNADAKSGRSECQQTECQQSACNKKNGCDKLAELKVGTRVRIVRHDPYYGREGEILGRRGKEYWNIRLTDGPSGEVVIYKRRSGFTVVSREEK
jgi:hypothetical protein